VGRALRRDEFFGLVEMVIFIVTVFVAYAYVWRRGGLDWD
jgi:NADH-quinone oxidoreductase subunit A